MFKKFVLGALVGMVGLSAVAYAQQTFGPFITGTNTEHRREVFDVGFLRLNNSNNSLTALAGGAQAGTQLTLGMNRFTVVATAADSAQLPALPGGVWVVVINATANSMNIFPPTGGTINALGANAAFGLAAGKSVIFYQGVDNSWYGNLSAGLVDHSFDNLA